MTVFVTCVTIITEVTELPLEGVLEGGESMEKTIDKKKSSVTGRLEEEFARVAFAEAGELYSKRQHGKKGDKKHGPVCRDGETPSGLCMGSSK